MKNKTEVYILLEVVAVTMSLADWIYILAFWGLGLNHVLIVDCFKWKFSTIICIYKAFNKNLYLCHRSCFPKHLEDCKCIYRCHGNLSVFLPWIIHWVETLTCCRDDVRTWGFPPGPHSYFITVNPAGIKPSTLAASPPHYSHSALSGEAACNG